MSVFVVVHIRGEWRCKAEAPDYDAAQRVARIYERSHPRNAIQIVDESAVPARRLLDYRKEAKSL